MVNMNERWNSAEKLTAREALFEFRQIHFCVYTICIMHVDRGSIYCWINSESEAIAASENVWIISERI